MLRGDAGVSNTDPFATQQTASNRYGSAPQHIMVLVPDMAMLFTLPADPNNSRPSG